MGPLEAKASQPYLPNFEPDPTNSTPKPELPPGKDFLYGLTIRQPWAQLIIEGWRQIEQRNRPTNERGFVVIHAGLKVDLAACRYFNLYPETIGAILGVADLYDVENVLSEARWQELRPLHLEPGLRAYGDGTQAFFLRDAIKFAEPIQFRGNLGLFKVSLSVLKPQFDLLDPGLLRGWSGS